MRIALALVAIVGLTPSFLMAAEPIQINYDEAKMPKFTLPDPLVMEDGAKVTSAEQWKTDRRPEILRLFEEQVYGKAPPAPTKLVFEVFDDEPKALDGKAIRKQAKVQLTPDPEGPWMDVLLYLPPDATGPVPTFLTLNFYGNHTVHTDPGIKLSESWMRNNNEKGTKDHEATEASRGTSASRWPVEDIVKRGYGLACIYYGDIDPDFHDKFQNGVHPYFYEEGQTQPKPDQWASIAAWAWGLSRGLDYLEQEAKVDAGKVIVMGHSRLGKTSLWAGATDERFAAAISNNSGCGGAALSRRRIGESVRRINTSFPHWFCENFNQYNDNEDECPVDQHQLVSLIAPRPALVCSAVDDKWADPKGEFLAAKHASPVYDLLGVEGLKTDTMPEPDEPVLSRLGYVIRPGGHGVLASDWQRYMDFADQHVK
ncbi:MAG: acetylxylan esterase [Pirellulaceae bacterium]